MQKKRPANFDPKDGAKLAENSARGRPSKGTVPSQIGGAVSRLAASYLEGRLPKEWKRSQLNLLMAKEDVNLRGKEPVDLLRHLAERKSVPLLGDNSMLTRGLEYLEKFPLFEGALQILDGPYTELLTMRSLLPEVHLLMCMCGHAQTSRLFGWSRDVARRTRRASSDELKELRTAIRQSKAKGAWRSDFFDFLAVALGLFQEAVLTHDSAGHRT